jgi:hypothetical protein
MGNSLKTDFLGNQYNDVQVPLMYFEITAANIDFETDIPGETMKDYEEKKIWTSYNCKKAVVWWIPEFDFSSGMVEINPKTLWIDAEIETEVDFSETEDPKKSSVEVSKENMPGKLETEDDGADRARQYGPHTILFTMDENNKVKEAKVFYT